ncbi:MAG: DUF4389 domain-containing protein [Candidatus Nomurabacteria bacterium]|nr:MAG: DUF4389 domain-containing protein [Candidatus Nomurabacteria bacterium]
MDYPVQLDRFTTFFRILWSVPILILLSILTSSGREVFVNEAGKQMTTSGGSIAGGLSAATALMIVFRQKYPKWWYNFALELNRFMARVGAYLLLLTDKYPSTDENQSVYLDVDYPNVEKELNRWLPLVKWLLAIPHYVVLIFLLIGVFFSTLIAWFVILFTGRYPRGLFDYVVGVGRWIMRVNAYAFLLTTDEYPPFSLK